jgi:hypothetical protein
MTDREDLTTKHKTMRRITDEGGQTRSMATDAAVIATPLAILAQPIVGAWANEHFKGEQPSNAKPPPQESPQQPCD